MRTPSSNPITLGFGTYGQAGYTQTAPHRGTDFGWQAADGSTNLTIVMPCDAVITQKPNNGADGNGTYFTSPDGRYYMGLLHAKEYLVPNGSSVKEGQPVATMGQTGTATGVHCHFAVIDKHKASDPIFGQYIDPLTLITGGKGGGTDMWTMTKEQIDAMVRATTWSYPGDGFDYQKYLGQPATQVLLDELITELAPYAEKKMQEYASLQQQVSAGTGAQFVPYNGSPLFTKVNGK